MKFKSDREGETAWYGFHYYEIAKETSIPGTKRFGAHVGYALWGLDYGTVRYTSRYSAHIRLELSPFNFEFHLNLFKTHLTVRVHGLYLESLQPEPVSAWVDYGDYPAKPSDRLDYLDAKLTQVLRNTEYSERTKALTVVYEHLVDIPRSQVDRYKYVDLVQLLDMSLRESTAS